MNSAKEVQSGRSSDCRVNAANVLGPWRRWPHAPQTVQAMPETALAPTIGEESWAAYGHVTLEMLEICRRSGLEALWANARR